MMTGLRKRRRHSNYQWYYSNILILLLALGYFIGELGSLPAYADATADNRNYGNERIPLPLDHQQQQEGHLSRIGGGDDNIDDNNNGIVQVIESEVWDALENVWKGAAISGSDGRSRWTNEKGNPSPSPPEVIPPEGWEYLGEWKIVVRSSNNNDSKGWEYQYPEIQYQYLQPPTRRRIWLRSLTQTKRKPRTPLSRFIPKAPPTTITTTAVTTTKVKHLHANSLSRTVQKVRDDWNYKGLGFNLYKSFIFPSSVGVAVRLPLTIHFDSFDRNPAWPIISTSAAVFYPPMVAGFLSGSVHVEWVKWIMKYIVGLIPRISLLIIYRLVFPLFWTIASILLFPFKYELTSRPTTIPNRSWWTGGNIAKPHYNTQMSERIGISVSYRWSKSRGYEGRISYWHSYLPTLLVYQQFLLQLQERFRKSITLSTTNNSKSFPSSSSLSSSSTGVSTTSTMTKNKTKIKPINWLRKHFASLGVSSSGPIPDTPPFSCSANFSLSGLYFGSSRQMSRGNTALATGSRTDSVTSVTFNDSNSNNTQEKKDQGIEDITPSSTKVLASPIRARSTTS